MIFLRSRSRELAAGLDEPGFRYDQVLQGEEPLILIREMNGFLVGGADIGRDGC